ncbi:hypothetical protein [Desulfobacula phenolica]|uniref:Uncharacterized protein n=1 Tax=Desulfobacula phenolica TaxID=90732 RepID=A0A1H2JPW1_9BACT|nr:hypothetical protein [Desulfobacula phenolica]SDU58353.1 hypothetical protein SAMN04487931_11420 [Desulfobacula phenolica]
MKNNFISIPLSVDDGQKIFQALSELPFKYVYELIGKLNRTTNETAQLNRDSNTCYEYALVKEEIDLMIQALGQMPYKSVHKVIAHLENTLNSHGQAAND